MTSSSLFTAPNSITSHTTPFIMLDAVSILLGFRTNIFKYKKLPMPSKFIPRIADARIHFKESGYATISEKCMNTNGKRLFYASLGKPYPMTNSYHNNLMSEADKKKLLEINGHPQEYLNQLLVNLLDDIQSYIFANHTRLQFYSTQEEIETEYGLFVTNDITSKKINYLEYCIEFPFQIRPDIQQMNLAKALSSMFGENKDLHYYKGKDIDLRWTIPIPSELKGTEMIEIKGYPKEFEFEDDAHGPYKEQVYRVELKFHNPKINDDKLLPLEFIKKVIETVSDYAARTLTEIYLRSVEPPSLYSYGEISQRVLASLQRGKNDKRVDAFIESIFALGAYTRSHIPEALRLSYNQLGRLKEDGVIEPLINGKQAKSHIYVPLSEV